MSLTLSSRFFIQSHGIPYDVVNIILAYLAPKHWTVQVSPQSETLEWKRNLVWYRKLFYSTPVFRTMSYYQWISMNGTFQMVLWRILHMDDLQNICIYGSVQTELLDMEFCYMYILFKLPTDADGLMELTKGTLHFPLGNRKEITSFQTQNDVMFIQFD